MKNKEKKPRIITEKEKLKKKCKPCDSVLEGDRIGKELLDILSLNETGVGLAANQVGIDARVCVINVTKPIILVNPQIISRFGKIYFKEGCLSFPGEQVVTERFANIAVNTDDHNRTLFFKSKDNALECVCVQHEIDHLNGITMYERVPSDYYEINKSL